MYRLIFVFLALSSVRSAHITVNVDTLSGRVSLGDDHQFSQNQLLPYESSGHIIQYAHSQNAQFTITYNSKDAYLEVVDSVLLFGKWVKVGTCNEGTSPNALKITKDNPVTFKTCGRDGSPSGTEGYFYLRKQGAQSNDYKVTFSAPWGLSGNKFKMESLKDDPEILCEEHPVSSSMVKNIRCFKLY